MNDTILVGNEDRLDRVSAVAWQTEVSAAPEGMAERLRFMSPDHHRVRRFAVSELVKRGRPLEGMWMARELALSADKLDGILGDLETHLFFLVRDGSGHVNWAFPVTSEPTSHRLRFTTGEQIFGA